VSYWLPFINGLGIGLAVGLGVALGVLDKVKELRRLLFLLGLELDELKRRVDAVMAWSDKP
jgi:hypothetical protein